jgi:hypothetical protein
MKFLACMFFILSVIKVSAQDTSQTETTNVSRVTVFSPGFSYEHKTGKNQTLYVHPSIGIGLGFNYSDAMGFRAFSDITPMLITHYRFYYNGSRRAGKGKRTAMNSMNYLAPMAQVAFVNRSQWNDNHYETRRQTDYALAGLWGMQRNYGRRLSIDFNAGLGMYFWSDVSIHSGRKLHSWRSQVSPATQFTLGFWLNKQ